MLSFLLWFQKYIRWSDEKRIEVSFVVLWVLLEGLRGCMEIARWCHQWEETWSLTLYFRLRSRVRIWISWPTCPFIRSLTSFRYVCLLFLLSKHPHNVVWVNWTRSVFFPLGFVEGRGGNDERKRRGDGERVRKRSHRRRLWRWTRKRAEAQEEALSQAHFSPDSRNGSVISLSLSLIMIQSLYYYFSFHVVSNNAFHGSFSLFKECPHPDEKQRMKLSQDLSLKPRQVKFWFQNRRTQMKVRNLASLTSSFLKISTVFGLVCAMKRIPCSS